MIEEFIYSVLSESAELADYRGGGVYPYTAPKKTQGWHLTYAQVSAQPKTSEPDSTTTRWQINIIPPAGFSSDSYRSGKTAAKIVQSLLEDFSGVTGDVCIEKIEMDNQTDISDINTSTFFVAQDYLIKYFEA